MEKFQNKYRIPSARAWWHAYKGGFYFVTICTANRLHHFGEIINGEMILSAIGNVAKNNLDEVPIHYLYAEIPLFAVMPNHIHAIIVIDDEKTDVETGVPFNKMAEIAQMRGRLSVVVGGLKSAITRIARQHDVSFAWQSRFHDRIIRNQNEMNRITEYIINNVAQWELDELNKHSHL